MPEGQQTLVSDLPLVSILQGRTDYVLERCAGKSVLHLGCVDEGLTQSRGARGQLLHQRLLASAGEVVGVDSNLEGIRSMGTLGMKNIYAGNVEACGDIAEIQGKSFEVILACEILEHLNNPGLFLGSVRPFFGDHTVMILSTPNALRATNWPFLLRRQEAVHPDHNYWFSYRTLMTLLRKYGYEVLEANVYRNEFIPASFVAHYFSRIRKRLLGGGSAAGLGLPTDPEQDQRSSIRAALEAAKRLPWRVLLKILYGRTPYIADGLLFVVRPRNGAWETECRGVSGLADLGAPGHPAKQGSKIEQTQGGGGQRQNEDQARFGGQGEGRMVQP